MIATTKRMGRKSEDFWDGWHEGWTDGFESREWADSEIEERMDRGKVVAAFLLVSLSSALIGFLLGVASLWDG